MVLFDGSSHGAGDADAVAAHDHGVRFTIVIEESSAEGFTVFRAQFEYLAYFDAFGDDDMAAAMGANVFRIDLADGGHFHIAEVTSRVHMDEMHILQVAAAASILHFHDGAIADDFKIFYLFEADGADVAGGETAASEVFFRSHVHIDGAEKILQLHFVHFMVAAHHSQHHGVVQLVYHSLDRLLHVSVQEIANHFDGVLTRRGNQFFFFVIVNITGEGIRVYGFDICCEIAIFTVYDVGFAAVCQYFEFVGCIAADGAGVSDDRTEFQTATGENAIVRIIHELVLLIEAFFVHIEGVAVFHDEFAAAHETEARTLFISVLVLDLVNGHRELLIRRGVHRNQRGHQFFVGRRQAIVAAVAILQLEHFFPIHSPTAGFLPDFRRLHDGHQDFLRPGLVDFLADNLLHLLNGTESQWQVCIGAVGNLTHHAGFQHIFMAHHHRIGGQFSQGWAV